MTEKCSWAGGSEIVLQPFLALGCHVWNPDFLAHPRAEEVLGHFHQVGKEKCLGERCGLANKIVIEQELHWP